MILVLGGAGEASLRRAVRAGVSQAVYTPRMLEIMQDEAVRCGRRALAHLKIDTGMSRIGVRGGEDLSAMLAWWRRCPDVEMEGVFTHFCVADTDPEFTALQNRRFAGALAAMREAGFDPIAHAAASTAMLDPALQYDMVRPGIVLYGSCVPELADELTWAQTLVTRPIRLQWIAAGDTVGYGRTFTAEAGYAGDDAAHRLRRRLSPHPQQPGVGAGAGEARAADRAGVHGHGDGRRHRHPRRGPGRRGGAAGRPGGRAHHPRRAGRAGGDDSLRDHAGLRAPDSPVEVVD